MPPTETPSILLPLRDYGALGLLVLILLYAGFHLWRELSRVRAESDERAKKHFDQIEALVAGQGAEKQKLAETFTEALKQKDDNSLRQSEIFAAVVRESNAATHDLAKRLLDLADKE